MAGEFETHLLNPAGINACIHIAAAFDKVLEEVKFHVPPGRALSLVVTELQKACHFAKRGVAEQPCNQDRRANEI
jgi:hypothetical protein